MKVFKRIRIKLKNGKLKEYRFYNIPISEDCVKFEHNSTKELAQEFLFKHVANFDNVVRVANILESGASGGGEITSLNFEKIIA